MAPLTIQIDFVVEDAKGHGVAGLRAAEVEVQQDGRIQRISVFQPGAKTGEYELRYAPASERPGPVTLRVLRPGTKVRGREGPGLKPRIVTALSPFEKRLAAVLEASPAPAALSCRAAVLRFEASPEGLHHTLLVEVPVGDARHLELFARLSDSAGTEIQRYTLDRAIDAPSGADRGALQLVWTAQAHLRPGRYVLEAVVRDVGDGRAGVARLTFDSPAPGTGLQMSGVALVSPISALLAQESGSGDDPLFFEDAPLMPTLALALPQGADARVRFFVVIYPAAGTSDPVSLRLELLRDGEPVGETAIPIPPPDARGEIRYLGGMPVGSFRSGAYTLRLVARQADAEAAAEAAFVIGGEAAPVRLGPSSP